MFNRKYLFGLLFLTCVLTSSAAVFADRIFTDTAPKLWLFAMIIFLGGYEWVSIIIINRKNMSNMQSVNVFMGFEAGRFLLSLSIILIYYFAVGIEKENFILCFAILYIIYLVFNTFYLKNRENLLKKEKQKNVD
ncbi:MAG: hypothetical protein LBT04_01960 [Prevotellaceae bacterium]|jgi:hypothetical protein|nr:hypothetical protein [Prevotellaceae bacterium]